MILSKLYKQTNTGAIQEWQVSTAANTVTTDFGQYNSPNMQKTSETVEGKKFKAKMKGKTEDLKVFFENQQDYIGKKLTVQYQGLTPDGIPRFPVGLRIRIEE